MSSPPAGSFYVRVGKRLLDFVLVIPCLLAVSALLLITAILIKLDSPGPVLFRQERLGKNGRVFVAYKFRSMTDKRHGYTHRTAAHLDNSELTRVGAVIRRLKIDELPQLLNILRGDMSLVGPRPAMPAQLAEYTDLARERLTVRPGLTGLAQVNGNTYLTWPERWQYDAQYARTPSFVLDLQIIAKTFAIVLLGEKTFLRKSKISSSSSP